jgi:uncharacterized membrane-anchored protein
VVQKGREKMIAFINAFLIYFITMLIIVVFGGGAIALGIYLRKQKNRKEGKE